MLNDVNIQGRLTDTPELKVTQSGTPVTSFTVACERNYADEQGNRETDFFNCVAWRKTAEHLNKYFSKGQMLIISGELQTRNYTDKNGNKRIATEVLVHNTYFCGKKEESHSTTEVAKYSEQTTTQQVVEEEDELPF